MSPPPNRHNNGPLLDEEARKLWGHVRALEVLEEQVQEVRDDQKARKDLAKADGFDTNILAIIIKRRKIGNGESRAADTLTKLYEEALEEQGALPLEETRRAREQRRSPEEIAQDLHGTDPPTDDSDDPPTLN